MDTPAQEGGPHSRIRPVAGMPPSFWVALVPGGALVVWAVHGLVVDSSSTNPWAAFRILIGLSLLNDLAVIPVALAVGVVIERVVPSWFARPLKAGVMTAAIVSLFALPAVHRWGAQATNTTVLPRAYLSGLLEMLIFIGAATAFIAVVGRIIRYRSDRGGRAAGSTGGRSV